MTPLRACVLSLVTGAVACASLAGVDEFPEPADGSSVSSSGAAGGTGNMGGAGGEGGNLAAEGGGGSGGAARVCWETFTSVADVTLQQEPSACPTGTISYGETNFAIVSGGAAMRFVLLRFEASPEAAALLAAADTTPVAAALTLTRTTGCEGGCPPPQDGSVQVHLATNDWAEGTQGVDGAMWCYANQSENDQWQAPGASGPEDRGPLVGTAPVPAGQDPIPILLELGTDAPAWIDNQGVISLLVVPAASLVLVHATRETGFGMPELSIAVPCP